MNSTYFFQKDNQLIDLDIKPPTKTPTRIEFFKKELEKSTSPLVIVEGVHDKVDSFWLIAEYSSQNDYQVWFFLQLRGFQFGPSMAHIKAHPIPPTLRYKVSQGY